MLVVLRISRAQRTRKPIAAAFARSMKNAETNGKMMKAVGAAPCVFVTAVILAMAVGVAPSAIPPKPAVITAASYLPPIAGKTMNNI